jgi:pyruvate dehydrogenase E2 component (dihydrolipoamide acetyltransferase)
MAEIIMPKMGDAMTEGKVVRWYKQAGDVVKKGEPVLEIETDKVNLDLEAEADGPLGEHQAKEGEMVPVGGVLATIGGSDPQQRRVTDKKDAIKHTTGEYAEAIEMKAPRVDRTAPEAKKEAPKAAAPKAPASKAAAPSTEARTEAPASEGRQRSSPLARRMARDLGVNLGQVQGSGPGGRVVAEDVKNFRPSGGGGQAPAPAALESRDIPLTGMRRTIAKRLAESTGPIPHFYLTVDLDVTSLLALRQQFNEIHGAKSSLNDFIIRAAALSLRHHPMVNASWGDEAISQHGEIHVGVAVSTPEGLITPVVRNADRKGVADIAAEVRTLADKAKNRKLLPNDYQGSTFTISSLGAWGVEEFTAIINPPNVAILAIGAAGPQPVVVAREGANSDRQVVVRDRMKVTMSCDHRVIDGAAGADYLKTFRQYIEQPLRLVM